MASAGASDSAGAGTGVAAGELLAAAGAEEPEAGAEDGCDALLAGAEVDADEDSGWEAGTVAAGEEDDDDDAAGAAAGAGAAGSSGAAAPQAMSRPAIRMNIPVMLSLGQPMVIGVPPSVTVLGKYGQ